MNKRLNTSAGLLLFRRTNGHLEVLLAHPGGPFWAKKDAGAWTIPKGLIDTDEPPLEAARREFREETGADPAGPFTPLGMIRQKSGKTVHAWACEGDLDVTRVKSNLVSIEWPPRSGRLQSFPEVDRCEWFALESARTKLIEAQTTFLDRLQEALDAGGGKEQSARGEGQELLPKTT